MPLKDTGELFLSFKRLQLLLVATHYNCFLDIHQQKTNVKFLKISNKNKIWMFCFTHIYNFLSFMGVINSKVQGVQFKFLLSISTPPPN